MRPIALGKKGNNLTWPSIVMIKIRTWLEYVNTLCTTILPFGFMYSTNVTFDCIRQMSPSTQSVWCTSAHAHLNTLVPQNTRCLYHYQSRSADMNIACQHCKHLAKSQTRLHQQISGLVYKHSNHGYLPSPLVHTLSLKHKLQVVVKGNATFVKVYTFAERVQSQDC
jgi:hypothetical protein